MSILRKTWLGFVALILLAGCQVAPGTGRESFNLLSPSQETALGAEEHPKLIKAFGGLYTEAQIQAYVEEIGQKLVRVSETPEARFTFVVLNSEIVNAMALPGGYIHITRGLLALADNEAELAGVLAHEIGHVTARHSAQRYSQAVAASLGATVLGVLTGSQEVAELSQAGAALYVQSYSRDQEFEADQLGVRYLQRAGYDPRAMGSFLNKLREQSRLQAMMAGADPDDVDQYNMMASHPRTVDRVERAMQAALTAPAQGKLDPVSYLRKIDGLLYGDDPSQGVIRGRSFLHPDLRFAFEVPDDFVLRNGDTEVTAIHPKGAGVVFDMDVEGANAWSMTAYLSNWVTAAPLSQVEPITISGLTAATGATTLTTQNGQFDVRLVAIRADENRIYRFRFLTPVQQRGRFDLDFRRTTYSFRQLSESQARQVRPYRIRTLTAQPGDSVAGLAERMPFDDRWEVERFLLLNGLTPNARLQSGQLLKTVKEGN